MSRLKRHGVLIPSGRKRKTRSGAWAEVILPADVIVTVTRGREATPEEEDAMIKRMDTIEPAMRLPFPAVGTTTIPADYLQMWTSTNVASVNLTPITCSDCDDDDLGELVDDSDNDLATVLGFGLLVFALLAAIVVLLAVIANN